ncbi:MAG TPA: hypothetical protein VFT96_10220 [Gemmatimonadaceae bacterium]|jgi:uncharacterized membrane protein|nr:hypothetical protein [Gemmatimonadaceae bacterium]
MSQVEIDDAEWKKAANWRGGMIYFSRRDSRPFVPKRNADMGITVNFAHPTGILFVVGVVAFAGLLIYLAGNS